MKVGLFNPYLDTMGGGERYFLTAASYYLNHGDTVDIFWNDQVIKSEIKERFNINVDKANFVSEFKTFGYDLIFFVSDGSIPLSFAKKTIIHFQVPFTKNSTGLLTKIKLLRAKVVCNSEFTKHIIDKSYGVNSSVIYPPVDVEAFNPGKKENIILSVGRFFAPSHPKKQEIMIREFVNLYRQGLKDWKLILIGGITLRSDIDVLKKKCSSYPIKIIADADLEILKDYYSKAKIYWHATGYGENLELTPDRAEHFGISTVEAMASGCVPICFAGGGQLEIIDDGVDGFLWKNTEEWREKTMEVVKNNKGRIEIASNAIEKSKKFSKTKFFKSLESLL